MYLHLKVDKAFAPIGEIINYTLMISNDEDEDVKDVSLIDVLPDAVKSIEDSFTVDGQPLKANLQQGIQLGKIPKNTHKQVAYSVIIEKLPPLYALTNSVDLSYKQTTKKTRVDVQSNTVITLVTDPCISEVSGGIKLEVDKEVVDLGEVITYTLTLQNKGNLVAEEITIKTLQDTETTQTLMLPRLEVGESYTTQYQVVCNKLPTSGNTHQQVHIDYHFTLANREKKHGYHTSNTCITKVETATFSEGGIVKNVSLRQCTVGDVLTYTLLLNNKGNKKAENICYMEPNAEGTTVVEGSIFINGIRQDNFRMTKGISLGTLEPEQNVHLTYSVQVGDFIPTKNPVGELGKLTYTYESGGKLVEQMTEVERVSTKVQGAILKNGCDTQCFIQMLPQQVELNEQIQATLVLCNKGNQDVEHMSVYIPLPEGVKYNGEDWNLKDEGIGFEAQSNIKPEEIKEIPFYLSLTSIPKSGEVSLQAVVSYHYHIGKESVQQEEIITQTIPLSIQVPLLDVSGGGVVKSVDKVVAQVGDTLHYTLWITNTGNSEAEAVTIHEQLPSTVSEKEEQYIGTIKPGEQKVLQYAVKVINMDESSVIDPETQITYAYKVGGERRTRTIQLNGVVTTIEMAYIQGHLQVDKNYVTLGDVLHYTLELSHIGNLPAQDLEIILPSIEGARWQHNGCSISQLAVGETLKKYYSLEVESFATSEQIDTSIQVRYHFKTSQQEVIKKHLASNEVSSLIGAAEIKFQSQGIQKEVSHNCAVPGEILIYSIKLQNTGNRTAEEVVVKEQLPPKLKLIPETIRVNGLVKAQESFSIPLAIGRIEPQERCTITYHVQVMDTPEAEEVAVLSFIQYQYKMEETKEEVYYQSEDIKSPATHILETRIMPNYKTLLQQVNQEKAYLKDLLTYTISLHNKGNVVATSPYYQINLGEGLQYVEGSLQINGMTSQETPSNIRLDDLLEDQSCEIIYQAQVMQLTQEGYCIAGGKLDYIICKPDGEVIPQSQILNTLQTSIYGAGPLNTNDFVLALEDTVAALGDQILASFTLKNTGNLQMEDIHLTLHKDTTYLIEVEAQSILPLAPNATQVIQRLYEVIDIPHPPYIGPIGEVSYRYGVDQVKVANCASNEATLHIQDPALKKKDHIVLTADKQYAELGESINYEAVIKNKGNTSVLNLVGKIELTENLQLDESTLRMGYSKDSKASVKGIYAEKIQPDDVCYITFSGKVISCNKEANGIAKLSLIYSYKDGKQELKNDTLVVKSTDTQIRSVDFSGDNIQKTIPRQTYTLGETINYTIQCKNNGNIIAKNVTIAQSFPIGIKLLKDTLRLGEGERVRYHPTEGIQIGDLGRSEEVTLTFQAEVLHLNESRIWEDVTTISYHQEVIPTTLVKKTLPSLVESLTIKAPHIEVKMQLEQQEIMLGDKLGMQLRLTNTGNKEAEVLDYTNLLPKHFKLAKEQQEKLNKHTLSEGESSIHKLQVEVTGPSSGGKVNFTPEISYDYQENDKKYHKTDKGNPINLTVHTAQLAITITSDKDVDKVKIGDSVLYTQVITNRGTLPTKQVKLYQHIPPAMTYIEGNVTWGNQQMRIQQVEEGMNIGTIEVGETMVFKCQQVVAAYYGKFIENTVYAQYSYPLLKSEDTAKNQTDYVTHRLKTASPYTKTVSKRQTFMIPPHLPDMKKRGELKVEVQNAVIRNYLPDEGCVAIAIELECSMTYEGDNKVQQEVNFKTLVMEKLHYVEVAHVQTPPLSVEVKVPYIGMLNPRQIEVLLEMIIEI